MKTLNFPKIFILFFSLLIFSCGGDGDEPSESINNNNSNNLVTSISLSSNVVITNVLLGETITFTVTTNTNQNVSSSAIITVNGMAISGNTLTPTTAGTFSVIATYDGLTSNTLQVSIQEPTTKFNKRVLIEDYTGTWCGYCPRVAYGIELVKAQTTGAVSVAIHRGSASSSSDTYDPFNYSAGALEDLINLGGYPTAMLNRTTEWTYPEPNNINQVAGLTTGDANLGLALTPLLNGGTISLDVKVKFGASFTSTNAKLVVYVLEDGLNFNQANYTSYYNGQNPIINFQHNDVLRASLTNLLGDIIPSSEIVAENVYTKSFSVAVPSNVTNSSNIRVVAFVVDGNSNGALNVRSAHFGDTQTFEEL